MTAGPDPALPPRRRGRVPYVSRVPRLSRVPRGQVPHVSRAPRLSRVPHGRQVAAMAAVLALGVSACAVVPVSGAVQPGKVAYSAGGQGQDYLQLIPRPPQPGWSPKQVVLGFLAACASFADNHAVARQYLDPTRSTSWNPGWAVTVVGTSLRVSAFAYPHQAAPSTRCRR